MLSAIIPAAGASHRMQAGTNKQFLSVAGQPVLTRTLLSLKGLADEYIIVCKGSEVAACREAADAAFADYILTPGGTTRQESVYAGLLQAGGNYVLIHDGCRPFASRELINRVIAAARTTGAAIPALALTDTIKEVKNGTVKGTADRNLLQAVQTPQVFLRELLLAAYQHASMEIKQSATDDAFLVEQYGQPVAVVQGEATNIKITHPQDIHLANRMVGESMRTGIGFDVHKLVKDRKLILGGVHIPYPKGLLGHSDADVLVHAVMDSLLGAAGLGDIGRHFPDTDSTWRDADSLQLLLQVGAMLAAQAIRIINIDAVIIAEQPKVALYISQMERNIAVTLGLGVEAVNVKASTTEGLGVTGRGEGIGAQSVCTLAITG